MSRARSARALLENSFEDNGGSGHQVLDAFDDVFQERVATTDRQSADASLCGRDRRSGGVGFP